MRTSVKGQLIGILKGIKNLHGKISRAEESGERMQFCEECQRQAITVGETLEQEPTEQAEIVNQLEKYCEQIFFISQEKTLSIDDFQMLDYIIDNVKSLLDDIPATYHVVFLPYKAEMWDSLESIWRSCRQDKRCECCVVPIPYYQYNAKEGKWEYNYEGERFPEEVSVVSYQNYDIGEIKPDIAYIHNPYDNSNYVTSVHPAFYSDELKKCVKKLVYVPYYITSGFISPEHMELPVYYNMDYMIAQSEYFKRSCEGAHYYEKILPLGSPKLDCVIQICRTGVSIPKEWEQILKGKKILMLNTSIGCFLQQGKAYLKKIRYICDLIRKQEKIAIIWRPHPLLEATMKSMRPQLLPEYYEVKEYFRKSKAGVFDQTPDITETVAIADAYIGEEGTSVINLFGAAGKPIFILDNYIYEEFTDEERRRVHVTDIVADKERFWVTTNRCNGLFYIEHGDIQVHFAGKEEGEPKWYFAYPTLELVGREIYFAPYIANMPLVLNLESQKIKRLLPERLDINMCCQKIVIYENRIFYLPALYETLMEYDRDSGQWSYHSSCMEELHSKAGEDNINEEVIFDGRVQGGILWMTATYTNYILEFHIEDGTHFLHRVGEEGMGYSGIAVEGESLWLSEVHDGSIVKWNPRTDRTRICRMPEAFQCWRGPGNRYLAHRYLIDMGKCLVTIPGYSNGMVKIEKETGKASLFMQGFWKDSGKETNGYAPYFHLSSEFGKKMDEKTILVQRAYDDKMAIVNIENDTCKDVYPDLTKKDFQRLISGEDGFEKREEKYGFFRRESKIFSIKGFMEDMADNRLEEVKKRQKQELSTLAANLDGTCGKKVHQFMMHIMEQEQENE